MCVRECVEVEKAGQAARPIYSALLPGISIRPPVPSPVDSFSTFAFDHFPTRKIRDPGHIANRSMAPTWDPEILPRCPFETGDQTKAIGLHEPIRITQTLSIADLKYLPDSYSPLSSQFFELLKTSPDMQFKFRVAKAVQSFYVL